MTAKPTWTELKQRRMVQWVLAYLAGAWLVFQVVGVLAQGFGWAVTLLRITAVVLGVGFFIAVVLAWYHGEQGRQRVSAVELAIVSVLLALGAVGFFIVQHARTRPAARAAELPAAPSLANSMAVLPFVSMSTDQQDDYFADGMTEELINSLSRVPGLRVVARTSSFAYKKTELPAEQIADKLRVGRLLTGSVQRSGTRVRIRAQLVNASDGTALWSDSFDREMSEIFAIQDEISRAIVSRLQLSLAGNRSVVRPTTSDIAAYNLYLQGLFFWNRRTAGALQESVKYFQQAIDRDSTFALAYVGLADSYAFLVDRGFMPHAEGQPKAMAAVHHALALDSLLAEAHASLGHLLMHEFKYDESEREFRRAIELNPNAPRVHTFYALLLNANGRYEEARVQNEQALALDPFDIQPIGFFSAIGDHDRTIKLAREALARDPQFLMGHVVLSRTLARTGDFEGALAEAKAAVDMGGGYHPEATPNLAMIYAMAGNDSASRRITDELQARAHNSYVPPYFVSRAFAAQGDKRRMYEWLDRAVDIHDGMIMFLKIEPAFDRYRTEARFRGIMKQVGY